MGRIIDCISGYAAVQFVVRTTPVELLSTLLFTNPAPSQGIYPTLLIVVLRESLWNSPDDPPKGPALSTIIIASRDMTEEIPARISFNTAIDGERTLGRVVDVSFISDAHLKVDGVR